MHIIQYTVTKQVPELESNFGLKGRVWIFRAVVRVQSPKFFNPGVRVKVLQGIQIPCPPFSLSVFQSLIYYTDMQKELIHQQ